MRKRDEPTNRVYQFLIMQDDSYLLAVSGGGGESRSSEEYIVEVSGQLQHPMKKLGGERWMDGLLLNYVL